MNEPANTIDDPVHGVRYVFERRGEDLFVESWMQPGGELPKHFHPVQEEHWFAIEGEVEVFVDGSWRTYRPEDGKAIVKPGTVHGVRNRSGSEVHLGTDVSPALHLEEFLTDSARAAREGLFMKGGIPKSLKGARWAAGFLDRHSEETVMTFPPRPLQRLMTKLLAPR